MNPSFQAKSFQFKITLTFSNIKYFSVRISQTADTKKSPLPVWFERVLKPNITRIEYLIKYLLACKPILTILLQTHLDSLSYLRKRGPIKSKTRAASDRAMLSWDNDRSASQSGYGVSLFRVRDGTELTLLTQYVYHFKEENNRFPTSISIL